MYGNSGKLGRGGGGGRGASKRMLHNPLPLPPPHRPAGAARLPIGAASSRNRTAGPGPGSCGAAPPVPEETFSLASNEPLAFSMIMRLTPDLVDEIGRVEAHGGAARIKFGPNSNNPSGNVTHPTCKLVKRIFFFFFFLLKFRISISYCYSILCVNC